MPHHFSPWSGPRRRSAFLVETKRNETGGPLVVSEVGCGNDVGGRDSMFHVGGEWGAGKPRRAGVPASEGLAAES